MFVQCAVCGKEMELLHPDIWAYKRGTPGHMIWFCRWKHLREYEKGKEDNTMARMKKDGTPARKPGPKPKTAMPAPIAGGDWEKVPAPVAELKLDGPIRIETPEARNVQVVETPERGSLADAMAGMKAAADNFFGQYCPEEKKEEQPEPEKPAPFKYRVTGIQTEVGEFWVVREGKIKWVPGRLAKEDPVMQVMWPEAEPALVPEMWRRFAEIILDVLDLLEVES